MKELFIESNAFYSRGTSKQRANDACDRVATCLIHELGLKRWKDFSHISEADLSDLAGVSADESVQVQELVNFSREANLHLLQKQLEITKDYMEMASKSYSELQKSLALFRNFLTVGVPLEASLNELANLKTKALEMREQHIRELQGTRAAANESIEEDSATHSLRPKIATISTSGQSTALSIPTSINIHTWSREVNLDTTSFRQQLRSLQLNTATTRLFRKCFVDANLGYVSFIGERRNFASLTTGGTQLSSSSSNEENSSEHVEPIVITFEKKKADKSEKSLESSSGGSAYRLQDTSNSLLLMHSITGDTLMQHTAVTKASDMMDVLLRTPQMADFEISRISDSSGEFTKNLLALEARMANTNYKVGVLYVRAGQTREEEYFANHNTSSGGASNAAQQGSQNSGSAPGSINFDPKGDKSDAHEKKSEKSEKLSASRKERERAESNHSGSPESSHQSAPFSREYEQFLKLLGDKVELQGWQNFSGGLDTRDNRNGSHSIYSVLDNGSASIMFHVATMMPFDPEDEDGSRIERKKHIGNDVVCVVFVEEGGTFSPFSLRSEFVHVYLVVQPTTVNNRTYYKVEVISRNGVSRFGPSLPNCLFPQSKLFSLFLLTKIVNADIASTSAPAFQKRITRTREALLGDLMTLAKTRKWIKRNSVATAPSLHAMTAAVTASALASGTKSSHGDSLTSSSASRADRSESHLTREKTVDTDRLTTSSSPRDPSKELHKEVSAKSLGPRSIKARAAAAAAALEASGEGGPSSPSSRAPLSPSSRSPSSTSVTSPTIAVASSPSSTSTTPGPEKSPSKKSLAAHPLRPRDKQTSTSDLNAPRPPRDKSSTGDSLLLSPSPVSSNTKVPKKRESFDTRHASNHSSASSSKPPSPDLAGGTSSAASTTDDLDKKPKKSPSRKSVTRDDMEIKPTMKKKLSSISQQNN